MQRSSAVALYQLYSLYELYSLYQHYQQYQLYWLSSRQLLSSQTMTTFLLENERVQGFNAGSCLWLR